MTTQRILFIAIFLACLGLMVFGLYLEHFQGLEPCPLCIFQRIAYITVGVIALLAAIHGPKKLFTRIYASLIGITSVCGIIIAGRQVWLQHLPEDQVPACGPGLEYMLDVFPLAEAIPMIFEGSGECAEVQWTFLSFSIAEWSLLMFSVFIITSLALLFYKKAIQS